MSERRVPRGPWARGCCGDRPVHAVGSGAAGAVERGQGGAGPGDTGSRDRRPARRASRGAAPR